MLNLSTTIIRTVKYVKKWKLASVILDYKILMIKFK